jgi:hypothetical protein
MYHPASRDSGVERMQGVSTQGLGGISWEPMAEVWVEIEKWLLCVEQVYIRTEVEGSRPR